MPKGHYKHKNGQGFLHRTYLYTIQSGEMVVFCSNMKRKAVAAFKRMLRQPAKTPDARYGIKERLPSGTVVILRRNGTVMRRKTAP